MCILIASEKLSNLELYNCDETIWSKRNNWKHNITKFESKLITNFNVAILKNANYDNLGCCRFGRVNDHSSVSFLISKIKNSHSEPYALIIAELRTHIQNLFGVNTPGQVAISTIFRLCKLIRLTRPI